MATSASDDDNYFLWFSDVHYDPFYATKDAFRAPYNTKAVCNSTALSPVIGNIGCDSPKALVESALKHAAVVASSPSFIIISGDLVRHGVDMLYATKDDQFSEGSESRNENDVDMAANSEYHVDAMKKVGDILNEVVTIFAEAFPDVEIIISLGNNDMVPDYYLKLQDDTSDLDSLSSADPVDYGMLGIIYNSLSSEGKEVSPDNTSPLSVEDKVTFIKGGYYSRQLSDSLTILSINTVLYSSYYGPEPASSDDPGLQFAWMRQMLTNIRARGTSQAMIVGHVPPAYALLDSNLNLVGNGKQLWREKYINTYYDIVRDFDDLIAGQLFGHLHTDEFRVGVGKSAIPSSLSTPLLLAGSITPLHGNNPSFRKVFYGNNGTGNSTLLDYESHRYPMSDGDDGAWAKLYTFSEAYSFAADEISAEGLSANVFRSIIQSMVDEKDESSSIMNSYLRLVPMLQGAGSDGVADTSNADVYCNAECRRQWLCTLSGTTTVKQYNKCLYEKKKSAGGHSTITGVRGVFVFAVAFFVMASIAAKLMRRRNREQYELIEGNVEIMEGP